MPDGLRTRIAAALYKAVSENCDGYVADIIAAGQPIDPLKDEVLVDGLLEFPLLADAVIAELGLTREDNEADFTGPYRHRYVTDWRSVEAPYCRRCGRPHPSGECLRDRDR